MKLSSIFTVRENYSQGILDLLEETTLGTNGAKYKHLDTSERIKEADSPLFLSIERNEKTMGNITFCRRGKHWYIRYFAFKSFLQGSDKKISNEKGNSFLKRELGNFFNQAFENSEFPLESMYAYIDPKNDRSKWMSENFGFETIAQLATQSFSRIHPKKSNRLTMVYDWNEIRHLVQDTYGSFQYYFETHCSKPPFYALRNEKQEIIAFARAINVHWEIVRMPGKMGGLLTKLIPFIPLLRKIIKPKNHEFLVPEIVWSHNSDPKILNELFEAMLADQQLNLILWWTDLRNPIYKELKSKMNWGILHKIIGVTNVDVVQRRNPNVTSMKKNAPVFVTSFDMV